ncbi:MAG: DUF2092 domain-containing protein [Phycisphaerae bacterium]
MIRGKRVTAGLLAGIVIALPGALSADEPPSPASPSSMEPIRAIDQRCMTQMKAMSDFLKGLNAFEFTTESDFDVVDVGDQKLQFTRRMTVQVKRPDHLRATSSGAEWNKSYYFDGKNVSLFDEDAKVYSRVEAPANIGQMLDHMSDTYGLSVPTGDFLYDDVFETLTEYVQQARYVGETMLDGKKCHHLAFRQDSVDWQIWIADGKEPLPLKLVVTYKDEPTSPQYVARFVEWKTKASFDAKQFEFVKRDDMVEAPMTPIQSADDE